MMFKEPVHWNFVHGLNSKLELAEMIVKTDYENPSNMDSYDKS